MYTYKHKFWLANEEDCQNTNLYNLRKEINEAVEHYNDVSARARNPKKILKCNVRTKEIEILSQSEEPLARPNLALQVFSSYLAQGKMKGLVKNKALFRGSAEEIKTEDMNERISDDELLLEVIKAFRRSSSKENRDKILRIQEIMTGDKTKNYSIRNEKKRGL